MSTALIFAGGAIGALYALFHLCIWVYRAGVAFAHCPTNPALPPKNISVAEPPKPPRYTDGNLPHGQFAMANVCYVSSGWENKK